MDKNKWKESMNAEYGVRAIMNKGRIIIDLRTSYPRNLYPYNPNVTDGDLMFIRFMTQDELREGAAAIIAERYGLGREKARIRIDQTEDHDPDLYGYAFRDALDNTIVIVERDYMVAWVQYKEKAFSATRFAEAVEQVEIPIIAAMGDEED